MSDAPALHSLLARVETATGADRMLDVMIHHACGLDAGDPHGAGTLSHWVAYAIHDKRDDPFHFARMFTHDTTIPTYTASLDAAIALCERVLPDVVWSVRGNADLVRGHKAEALLSRFDSERVCFRDIGDVSHFTPALALLAAILRAKIAETTHD